MPEVYNWQLGRMATYVYDEKHPKELRLGSDSRGEGIQSHI
jgi:hypothetical protein